MNTVRTVITYGFSAWWFSEVYIWSTAQAANLAWVDPGRPYERPRLNERPVLLRSLFLCLAVAQAGVHLYQDYDEVTLPRKQTESPHVTPGTQVAPNATAEPLLPVPEMKKRASSIAQRSLSLVIVVALVGPFVYIFFLRSTAWWMAYSIGKTMHTLPRTSKPSGLTDVTALLVRFASSGLLLTLLWELSNQAFTIFAGQEPLKKGLPLTSDSKDPNGSLIAGLKAKKEIPKSMAFWELLLISTRFDDRRKSLYQDIDRRGGSTWMQVSNFCIAEIQAITGRIQSSQQPSVSPTSGQPQAEQIQTLPRISQPLRQDNVLNAASPPATTLQAVAGGVGTLAKSFGQSQGGTQTSPRANQLLEYGKDKVLSKEQQAQISQSGLSGPLKSYIVQFLQSPLGAPFRQPFARRISTVIFGSPNSGASTIFHAIQSLTKLSACSLKEDSLGQVQKDIPNVIRLLVSTIQSVQSLVQTLPPHWTDVEFDAQRSRQVKEVEELLDVLKGGLQEVLISFGEYAEALNLSRAELRVAKELVRGQKEEMSMKKMK